MFVSRSGIGLQSLGAADGLRPGAMATLVVGEAADAG